MEEETKNESEAEEKAEGEPADDKNPDQEQENNENVTTESSQSEHSDVPEKPAKSDESKTEEQDKIDAEEREDDYVSDGFEEMKVIDDMGGGSVGTTVDDSLMKFYKYMGTAQEEAETTTTVKKEVIKIDRTPYYERYAVVTKEIEDEKMRNNVIQKKLAHYFRRKKMDNVLRESGDQFESQQKYNKKLDAYGEFLEVHSRERNALTSELTDLKDKRDSKYHELTTLFAEMQQREKDTGHGLINTKTGKPIADKYVERLIRLQKSLMETVNTMRLRYIKLKNVVAETQNNIAILDKIDENLFLKDYEQLKIENRGLEDKIEEREEELSKLRYKYHANIQMLAHIREKSAALDSDMDNLKEEISAIDAQCTKVREQLNGYKQERDYYRSMANKIHSESGLLTEIELLRDMEDSMVEVKTLTAELEHLKEENKIKAQQIRNIRKHIELSTEVLAKRSLHKNVAEKSTSHSMIYKGRPSLYKPTIPEAALLNLKSFKYKPTFNWKINKREINKKMF